MAKNKPATTGVIERPTELTPEERDRQARERFRRAADEIASLTRDKDPDEELAFITEIVEEVREEHYEREQREAASGC